MSGVKERAQELLAVRLEFVTDLESARSELAEAQEGVRSAEGERRARDSVVGSDAAGAQPCA